MLHADNPRNIRTVLPHHRRGGFRPSRGRADSHDQVPPFHRRALFLLIHHHGSLDISDLGAGSYLDLHQKLVFDEILQLLAAGHRGLGHEVHRPRAHGVEHLIAEGADHHHGKGILGNQLPEKFDPVHPWQLHVQSHYIRLQRQNGVSGLVRIPCRAHYPDCRIPAEILHQQLTEYYRVFYDQNLNGQHTLTFPFPACPFHFLKMEGCMI